MRYSSWDMFREREGLPPGVKDDGDDDDDVEDGAASVGHNNEDSSSAVAFLHPNGAGISTERSFFPTTSGRQSFLVVMLAGALLMIVGTALMHVVVPASSTGSSSKTQQQQIASKNPLLNKLGWLGSLEKFRIDLAHITREMAKQDAGNDEKGQTIDITPLVHCIQDALDTVGVRGMLFGLFEGIEWYIPPDPNCDLDLGHGYGCGVRDIWWLQHYIGATAADKLVDEGSLLLDGSTGERLDDAASVMAEIHRLQHRPYTTEMSFHASHGFVWQYMTRVMPETREYPLETTKQFCGEYLMQNFYSRSTNKRIGSECYHGFGHAVFALVAQRQVVGAAEQPLRATTQFRPSGGFALTDEYVCEAVDICLGAPYEPETTPIHYCFGGFKHAAQLLSVELRDRDGRNEWLMGHVERCANRSIQDADKRKEMVERVRATLPRPRNKNQQDR